MTIPFLPEKRTQTIIMGHKKEGEPMELPTEHPLTPMAEELTAAIHSKDHQGVAHALEAIHEMMASKGSDNAV